LSLARNQLHQGDCVELLGSLDAGTVDLVFADPPFNIGYKYDVYDDKQQEADYLRWSVQWMGQVHRVLKSDGTFWLAIGDEYAAELKVEAKKIGFHCRSWVIWYYTFGVNCVNGFSRSHTHLFHFVKDPDRFTFNRLNPQIRVQSARQLVYADARANPNGRLPDNTWITRPQDAPLSFSPSHDTWYFARVAGTFKEREGFHGCQMPEQLLARIIRSSSNPQDLVLDPFGGSGTTLCVAKKLGRQFMGFELSEEYASKIQSRLEKTQVGDEIDGPEDPIESAPSTAKGKRRPKSFDDRTQKAVVDAYATVSQGQSVEYLLCDPELNQRFVQSCLEQDLGGSAEVWNRYLMELSQQGMLPEATKSRIELDRTLLDRIGYGCEVAMRLIEIDYSRPFDEILWNPDFAREFDRMARLYGPTNSIATSLELRLAVFEIIRRTVSMGKVTTKDVEKWVSQHKKLPQLWLNQSPWHLDFPGVYVLFAGECAVYVSQSSCMKQQIEAIMDNDAWRKLQVDRVEFVALNSSQREMDRVQSLLVKHHGAILNCHR
jgi:site-specific DNA-methyltransferase (adenine-specific)